MKILLIGFLVCVFFGVGFGQTSKSKPKPQSATATQISAKLRILQKDRTAVTEKLAQLIVKYSPEYFAVQQAKEEIRVLDEKISKLSILEASNNDLNVIEADLNSIELMKILIVQNQKIIELLEKLANKK